MCYDWTDEKVEDLLQRWFKVSLLFIQENYIWNLFIYNFHRQGDESFPVEINAEFTSDIGYFNVERDINPKALARSIASQLWSREYFDALKT